MTDSVASSQVLKAKARFFDRWAPSYDNLLPSAFYQAIHQRLLAHVQLSAQAHVLDVGCGTGRLLNRLAQTYPTMRGIGLDLSAEMVRQARKSNQHRPRLMFVQGRSDAIPFAPDEFEAVFSTISFLHYPDPQQVLQSVGRVLHPQGRFYLVDYTTPKFLCQREHALLSLGGMQFYGPTIREQFGVQAGLSCIGHYYLLGPVLLTVYEA